ncbi:MAG TPA: hypothetical protein VLK25_09425, partial [Allosphingosinicella sp.]|nr:hypothetical protein [Allosphingosinicella sp.]
MAAFGAASLCAAFAAQAQDNGIGPAPLKDFRLPGQTEQTARPQPQQPAPQPVTVAPPPPAAATRTPAAAPPPNRPAAAATTRPAAATPPPAAATSAPSSGAPRTIPENPQQPAQSTAP